MSIIETYNVSEPSGGEDPRGGDDRIREHKRGNVERMANAGQFWPTGASDEDAGKHVCGEEALSQPVANDGLFVVYESNGHAGDRSTAALTIGDGDAATADTVILGDGISGSRPYTLLADTLAGKRVHTLMIPIPRVSTGRVGGVMFSNNAGSTVTLLEVDALCFTAPSGGNVDFDIHVLTSGWTDPNAAGTTIMTTPPVVSITDGNFRATTPTTTFNDPTLANGEAWVFEVDVYTAPAARMMLALKIQRTD